MADRVCSKSNGLNTPPENQVYGPYGYANNWAHGFYGEEAHGLADRVLEAVRRETEECDRLQGFQMTHSVYAGTGGGLGSQLLTRLAEEYPQVARTTYSVLPSYVGGDGSVVQPYNTVLSLHYLTEVADLATLYSYRMMGETLNRGVTTGFPWDLYSQTVADTMLGATASSRFSTPGDKELSQFIERMVPAPPRMHFLTSVAVPLASRPEGSQPALTDLTAELLREKTWTMLGRTEAYASEQCLAYTASFRGIPEIPSDTQQLLNDMQDKESCKFIEWLPSGAQFQALPVHAAGHDGISATSTGNFTSVTREMEMTLEQFDWLYSRKRYIRTYEMQGMDEMEFTEARYNIKDLVEEYKEVEGGGRGVTIES
ncbi:Tubulin/FtsZ, GTPase domain-containing protein [Aspergillus karnatakaensis]|uniref:Tubulin/FtsZ, GTPase domain-containing protein n=1 Tax=Aspergillus karnatakaensis TaxID=1810916 RepID=UPI003CCD2CE0